MSTFREFTSPTARPLPVILLADVSGSMSADGKIDALNAAVAEMLQTFATEDDTRAQIHVAAIIFGGDQAVLHHALAPAAEAPWQPMRAAGKTPMGAAFGLAREMLEDRQQIPSRAYRPTLILVSDGQPTDEWESPLKALLASERASKAARFAMGIGADADKAMLSAFLADPNARVFEAHEAREIRKFFQWVTMSVTTRSRSANPNSAPPIPPTPDTDIQY